MPLALHPRVRALTTLERITILAIALAVFVFVEGPVWRHLWEPDAAILWSYAVIPAGVVVAFLRRSRPRLVPCVVESALLSIVKFGITAFALVALWSFGTPPAPVRPGGLLARMLGSKSTNVSSSERQRDAGGEALRTDASQQAAAAFAARVAAAQTVTVGNGGFSSRVIAVAPGGDVALRATDGHLHAVQVLAADGSILKNVPVLGSGAARLLSFEEISDGISLRCGVHPEERADLAVQPRR